MTNLFKVAGITLALSLASGLIGTEAAASQERVDSRVNSETLKPGSFGEVGEYGEAIRTLKDTAQAYNVELEITSIELNTKAEGTDVSAMETSCTVTGTISIAGQEVSISVTAPTCSEAIGMLTDAVREVATP